MPNQSDRSHSFNVVFLTRARMLALAAGVLLTACAISSAQQADNDPPAVERDAPPAAGRGKPVTWSPASKDVYVQAAARDGAGRWWYGTDGQGVYASTPSDTTKWTQYTTTNGLGDDEIYSLVTDLKGRVWAGHRGSGVSVWNGVAWKNYDSLAGPVGSRVFCMAVQPGTGDVWIGTDAGVTRYSDARDTWTTYTQADGLSDDRISALAFDDRGTLYVGTQAHGVSVLTFDNVVQVEKGPTQTSPTTNGANATDVPSIKRVGGPRRALPKPAGTGLPTCQINDLAVAPDGEVFVATPFGLARSSDQGATWTYVRGRDWLAKAGAAADVPKDAPVPTLVRKDFVTRIAVTQRGTLLVGYRLAGAEELDRKTLAPVKSLLDRGDVFSMTSTAQSTVLGTVGDGVQAFAVPDAPEPKAMPVAQAAAPFPMPVAPDPAEVERLVTMLQAMPKSDHAAYFLGDDWTTRGDWVGRYGRQGMFQPWHGMSDSPTGTEASVHVSAGGDGPYTYFASTDTTDPRSLFRPFDNNRLQGEWNDGTWQRDKFPMTMDGPNLWISFNVPALMRVSVYFINNDGRNDWNRCRDYFMELVRADSMESAETAPVLATARVTRFYQPVYKQFVVSPGSYWLRVVRQHSYVTKCSAVMFDSLPGTDDLGRFSAPPVYGLPEMPAVERLRPEVRRAVDLWEALDDAWDRPMAASYQRAARLQAYRLAAAHGAPRQLLARWRRLLPMWVDGDREQFTRRTGAWYERMADKNPNMIRGALSKLFEKEGQAWSRAERGKSPAPAVLDPRTVPLNAPLDATSAALAKYVVGRAGKQLPSGSGEPLSTDPADYVGEFVSGPTPQQMYESIGEQLMTADSFLNRKTLEKQQVGLAHAIATLRASAEIAKDPWLTVQIGRVMVLPNRGLAEQAGSGEPLDAKVLESSLVQYYRAAGVADGQIRLMQTEWNSPVER